MLKKRYGYDAGECDACKADLMKSARECNMSTNADFGRMKAEFGYGSRLDDEASDFHLCEDCWEKALDAVGLKNHPMRNEMRR